MKKKLSLKDQILNRFRERWNWGDQRFVNGGAVERWVLTLQRPDGSHYKASNASRRLREMESGKLSDGKTCEITLEKEEKNGSVWYRYKPQEKIVTKTIIKNTPEGRVAVQQEKTIFI